MRDLRRILLTVLTSIFCLSCSVTRHIPEGQYLVQKVSIKADKETPRKERIKSEELETYIRQTPNKRFLGTNFYIWLHSRVNPEKNNRWNNWKRRVGEAPVILDEELTAQSLRNLKVYMDSRGYFSSEARCRIDTNYRRKRVYMTYSTRQRMPFRIDSISYEFHDEFLRQIILPDTVNTLLHRGNVFDITVLDKERERITERLKELGYFDFTVGNIEYVADTLKGNHLVDLKVVINQNLLGYDDQGRSLKADHTVYRIKNITILPSFDPTIPRGDTSYYAHLDTMNYQGLNIVYDKRPNMRPVILRQNVPIYPNTIYNVKQVNRAYSDLMALGYFKSARISFKKSKEEDERELSYVKNRFDTLPRQFVREKSLDCQIVCTPTLRQSFKVDLEGSTTSSFYGLKATIGYQNRNIFRGAESFDASFSMGYEFMKTPEAKKKRATEFGFNVGLTFPRFLFPWRTRRLQSVLHPKTKIDVSVNLQDRSFYDRTLTSVGLSYLWGNSHYMNFSLKPIDINVVNVGYLDPDFLKDSKNLYLINSYKTQLIAGLSFGFTYNNQFKRAGRNATVIRFNAETAGNLVGGLAHLFSKKKVTETESYYQIFNIRYSQYFRTDLSMSRKIMLGEKTALAGRLYGGVAMAYGNSKAVPFDRLFYAGGSNSMRGWAPRTLGPGSTPRTNEDFPSQLGDLKLEANLELRFPIWGILHGATFIDVGNVWFLKSQPDQYTNDAVFYFKDFYKQLAFNTGIGLRFDIKFAVLRLDWGIQIHNPNNPAGERWIHNFKWKNTALNFGVGYPF